MMARLMSHDIWFICQLCIHLRFSLCSFFALVVIGLEGAGCVGSLQRGKGALGPGTVTLSRLSHPGGGLNHSSQWAPLQLAGDLKLELTKCFWPQSEK